MRSQFPQLICFVGSSLLISCLGFSVAYCQEAESPSEVSAGDNSNPVAIQFTFREQPWLEVLEWFTEQADMSLVVQQAPEGQFTYSDTRNYTPTEALDLLNGVLSARGFTLIRRGRTLVCANLSEGLPANLIARVEPDQLDKYGQYEIVEVMFPLGKRPPQNVTEEVRPLLGPHGTAQPLNQTKQLLVTTTAGRMRGIHALIQAIPEPAPPAKPQPAEKPPEPVLETYSIEKIETATLLEMINAMAGDAKIIIDPKNQQLNAFARPTQQTIIAQLVERFRKATEGQRLPELKVYEIDHGAPSMLISQIKIVVPEAVVQVGNDSRQIIAFATPDQHAAIQQTMQQLNAGAHSASQKVPLVYRVQHANPQTLQSLIQSLYPRATSTIDAPSGNLVIVATPDQQASIRQLLTKVDQPPEKSKRVAPYSLGVLQSAEVLQVLTPQVPDAKINVDEEKNRLVVVASERDHQQITELLQQLQAAAIPATAKRMQKYSVTPEQRTQFQRNHQQLAPDLKSIEMLPSDDDLLILATEAQHKRVASVLNEIRTQFVDADQTLKLYEATTELRQRFQELKDSLDPNLRSIRILQGGPPEQLSILATEQQHANVAELLTQLQKQLISSKPELKYYPVSQTLRDRFNQLRNQLAPDLRNIQIVSDNTDPRLAVVATPNQHREIQLLLDQLQQNLPPPREAQLRVFRVTPQQRRRFVDLQPSLAEQGRLANIQIIDEARPDELAVWGPQHQLSEIEKLLPTLKAAPPSDSSQLVSYPLKDGDPTSVETVLAELYPDIKVIVDNEARRVMVWTTADQHELIGQAIRQLDAPPQAGKNRMAYYRLGELDARDLTGLFSRLVPEMSLVNDRRTNSIIAWGTDKDHQVLSKTVTEFQQQEAAAAHTVVSYPVGLQNPDEVRRVILNLVSDARVVVDSANRAIIVWATPKEHQEIRETLNAIKSVDDDSAASLKIYSVARIGARDLIPLLRDISPTAQTTASNDDRQLYVWANDQQHGVIGEVIQRVEARDPRADGTVPRQYRGRREVLAQALQMLPRLAPRAQVITGSPAGTATILANDDEHDRFRTLLQSLEQATEPVKQKLVRYEVQSETEKNTVRELVQAAIPNVKFIGTSSSDEMLIQTTPSGHAVIQSIFAEVSSALKAPDTQQVEVYHLGEVPPSVVTQLLDGKLTRNLSLIPDAERNILVVRATAAQHAELAAAVESILSTLPSLAKRTSEVYPVQHADPAAIRNTLANLVPQATYAVDAKTDNLVVTAMPDHHQLIRDTIQQLDQPTANERKAQPYRIQFADLSSVREALQTLVPKAIIVFDNANRTLLATATDSEHEQIRQVIEQMDQPQTSDRITRVYRLEHTAAATTRRALSNLLPDAIIVDFEGPNRGILVTARATDHERIRTVVDQLSEFAQGNTNETRIYPLSTGSVSSLQQVISSLIPNATVIADSEERRLFVTGPSADHAQVSHLLTQLGEALTNQRSTVVYRLREVEVNAARVAVSSLVPSATVVSDPSSNALLITARADEQQQIASVIKQLDSVSEPQRRTEIYELPVGDIAVARDSLTKLLDEAEIVADLKARALLITADDVDHQRAAEVVRKLGSVRAAGTMTKIHHITSADLDATVDALKALLPQATVSLDRVSRNVIVTAAEPEQSRVDKIVAELNAVPENHLETKAYPLQSAEVTAARDAIQSMLPNASLTADSRNRALLVTGTAEEHEQVSQILKQLDRANTAGKLTRVYRFQFGNVNAARSALANLLPDATIVADDVNRSLMVTASESDHQRVAEAVTEMDALPNDPTVTQAYSLTHADPSVAQRVLEALLPNAVFASDSGNRTLVATATPDQQKRIQVTVSQMDQPNQQPTVLHSYSVGLADVRAAFDTLRPMYDRNPQVQLSADEVNGNLIVKAPPQEQIVIARIVSQIQNGANLSMNRKLVVYSTSSEIKTLQETVDQLFRDQKPKVDYSVNESSNQLIAIATPAQHAVLNQVVQEVQPDPFIVEVFPMHTADPFAIETAIDQLYGNDGARPTASGDTETQQLFVRGTRQQLDEVRSLLVKMGELPPEQSEQQRGTRVVPFRGDFDNAIRQIQQVWPRLRNNELRVLTGPQSLPGRIRTPRIETSEPAQDKNDDEVDGDRLRTDPQSSVEIGKTWYVWQNSPAENADEAAADQADTRPPVVIVPSQGAITIFSDDEAALNQVETLLRTIARQNRADAGAGNFAVFALRNAGARKVAKLLNELFEQMPISTRTTLGRVSMVADDRLNSVVVHGRPSDRAVIAELLRVLDSANVPDSMANARPRLVPVKYLKAQRIHDILQGVYETQLKTGGNRPDVEIPEGVEPELASILQQINTANAGPLLTLEVDDITNSIVVLAPNELSQEVTELIQTLDENARGNDDRDIRIVTLKNTNVGQLEEALSELISSSND